MKNKLNFKICPDCESKNVTVYLDSFLCHDCKFSVSSEVGYIPEKIIELKNLLSDFGVDGVFAEIIIKDNTISFDRRVKLVSKYKAANENERNNIVNALKSYKNSLDLIVSDTSNFDKEELHENRIEADKFFKEFGAINMCDYFDDNHFFSAIGRDEEITKVENILKNKEKSCALIIGPAGSGISNLAMSVAKRVSQNMVPGLKGCPIYKIDSAFINVGSVSGEMERTLKDILNHCRKADAILLFDDCEQLAEQGIYRGTNLDVSDRLVTAIDGLKIIFSTSEEKFGEKLAHKVTFMRKTEMVKLRELSMDTTIEIMQSLTDKMLVENKTKFGNDIIIDIADLSDNIFDRNLPDRCLGLMEKVSLNCRPTEKYTIHNVSRDDIISTLTNDFQIRILEDKKYRDSLIGLSDRLKTVIKGQNVAIETVVNELLIRDFRRSANSNRPSVIYATGPTGVGKTEMAKRLAEFLTNDKNAYFRLDMSQFSDFSKLELLTGSAHSSQLDSDFVKWVKNYPSGVLVLDEFEKASSTVQQVFLPVFDFGNMSTPRGRLFFRNMIIFITSNAIISQPRSLGFTGNVSHNTDIHQELAKFIPAELINRVQNVVFFEPLSMATCQEIVHKITIETSETFRKKGISLSFTDELINWVTQKGYSPKFNARELDRVFDKLVLLKLSQFFFETDLKEWSVDIVDDVVKIN